MTTPLPRERVAGGRVRGARAASVLVALVATTALAHPPGLSRSEWTRDGNEVSATFITSKSDATGDLRSGVRLPGCSLTRQSSKALENDGIQTELRFTCAASSAMTVDYSELFTRLGSGHRHFAKHDGADDVLYLGAPVMKLGAAPAGNAFTSVVPLGIEHILSGWDHLLFLLGLLLGTRNLRGVMKLATAFTVGHSVTLALAALQIWAPPVRLTESLIAASVVFVGVQNLRRKASEKHWPLAFAFGLIHGFGLAGALEAVALEGKGLLVRLFAFNLGVECGQLMVLLPLLPMLAYARKQQTFERRGVPVLGLIVVIAGGVALVQRAFGLG